MTVIGLDVGYSNLKIAVGEAAGSPRLLVRPAGAHLRTIGPERGSGAKVAEDILFISQRPEE